MFEEFRNILQLFPDDANRNKQQRQAIVDCLKQIKFFDDQYKNNPTQQLSFLIECQKHFKLEQFDPGQVLFYHGEKGNKLYILLEGIIDLYRPNAHFTANIQSRGSLQDNDNLTRLNSPKVLHRLSARRSFLPLHLILRAAAKDNNNQTSPDEQIRLILENEFQSKHEKMSRVYPGQCFGELALSTNKPRFASAKTSFELKQPTFVASLDKSIYDKIFFDSIEEVDNKVNSLEKIFPNVPKNVLIRISYNFQNKEYSHNQPVYSQNDAATHFYIIISGEIRLEYIKKKDIDNRFADSKYGLIKLLKNKKTLQQTVHLSILQAGSLFGLEEVIYQIPRKNTARCMSQTAYLYALPAESYFLYLKTDGNTGMVEDMENEASKKKQFYEEKAQQVEFLFQQRQNELKEQEQRNISLQSLRKVIEQEQELSTLITKLNYEEKQTLYQKIDSPALKQFDSELLNVKEAKLEYKFDDLDKKRHLITFFNSRKKVKKYVKNEGLTSSYFDYRGKIYNTNEEDLNKNNTTEEKLSFKNPFFLQATSKKYEKMIKDLESKYNPQTEQNSIVMSKKKKIDLIKTNVQLNSNTDENIIAIKNLYQICAQKLKDGKSSESSLNVSFNDSNESKFFLQKQQLLSADRKQPAKTKVMLRSKHNMFRGKPNRPFLLTHYRDNNLLKKYTTQ